MVDAKVLLIINTVLQYQLVLQIMVQPLVVTVIVIKLPFEEVNIWIQRFVNGNVKKNSLRLGGKYNKYCVKILSSNDTSDTKVSIGVLSSDKSLRVNGQYKDKNFVII